MAQNIVIFCSHFLDVTIEGFTFVVFYESCPNCRKKLELEENEEKNCPCCGAKDIQPERALRYVLVIDENEETHHLQGFKDSIESFKQGSTQEWS